MEKVQRNQYGCTPEEDKAFKDWLMTEFKKLENFNTANREAEAKKVKRISSDYLPNDLIERKS